MPPPRAEPTPSSQAEDGEGPLKAKLPVVWKEWLPLGVALVVLPLIAYALTTLILVPQMRKSLVAAGVAPAKASPQAPGGVNGSSSEGAMGGKQRQSVTLNKLLVNVAGTMASRYLLTSMTLVSDSPDFPNLVLKNEPQLRDMASGLMAMKTIVSLEKPGARNLLRGELIAGFNSIMGNAAVQELYFTEFAIQ